ncbi:MAG: hypothetical protein ACYTDX_08715 [Planctomycetota bacterium]|jgi:hypothetical protein
MTRVLSVAALALLLATPLAAQVPMGLQMRVDQSMSASDPDDTPEVKVLAAANGFEVQTGPATVLWSPSNTATGTYTLKGTFKLMQRSSHTNYYGLVFGGSDLQSATQSYVYFLVAQNGTFIIKHRSGDQVSDVLPRASHAAVQGMAADATEPSVNALEVRVGANTVEFVINGTVVHTAQKSSLGASTDGIWGVRVNHVLPSVVVEGLGVTQ